MRREGAKARAALLALASKFAIADDCDRMERQNRLLPLIAAFKILKACSLFALAFGLHHLRTGDTETIILDWCKVIRVDPDNRISHAIISKVTGLPPARLHALGIGTFFYGLLFGIEGMGLLLKKRWAEYMTVITTVTFLPLEVYELFEPHRKIIKGIVLAINVAILVYLLVNLLKARREGTDLASATPSSS
jgi:uncharacterized membrane protein (DUF2068 family)